MSQRKKMMIAIILIALILFYLNITHSNGYTEEKGMNKYLVFDSTGENNELLKKYNDVFNGVRDKIKEININRCDYEKDYMKIKFNSDDDLSLNKSLKFHLITITIRCAFEEDGKFYPQVFLDETLYELNTENDRMQFQKVLIFVTNGILMDVMI